MQPTKPLKKAPFNQSNKPEYSASQKIEIINKYRIAQMYKQLRKPIYQQLLKKNTQSKQLAFEKAVDILFKYAILNSKYHHRQKMRFERMPLLKYIKYDFNALKAKLQTKKGQRSYDDLEDGDDSEGDEPQYQLQPNFNESSLTAYKKKNQIKGKVIIAKGYDDLKARLIEEYGWTENTDHYSLYFDFKFISKKKFIDFKNLLPGQIINHYEENKSITAKFGLARNIRNMVALKKDHSKILPRCYDVNDVTELENFFQDFKITKMKSILIKFVQRKGVVQKQQQPIIRYILQFLTKQLFPLQNKLMLIISGVPFYVPMQHWQRIKQFSDKQTKQPKQLNANLQLFHQASILLQTYKEQDIQFGLNKSNIWIVKPASMSRGRGIKTFNNLNQILDYIVAKEISWVIQKYIQRPLILRKKKFDIRQWVLWSDFKPFRVWIYQQCYIRFCSSLYDPNDLSDRTVHLTNNSVTKGINLLEDGIQNNMMNEKQFKEELNRLEQQKQNDKFEKIIKPQMKKIIINSLLSVRENVVGRKNSLQVLGYDFMIDEDFKVWLIEVNSSPTMEYSTKVTTELVQGAMSGLADLIQNYYYKGKTLSNNQKLYGGWKIIADL